MLIRLVWDKRLWCFFCQCLTFFSQLFRLADCFGGNDLQLFIFVFQGLNLFSHLLNQNLLLLPDHLTLVEAAFEFVHFGLHFAHLLILETNELRRTLIPRKSGPLEQLLELSFSLGMFCPFSDQLWLGGFSLASIIRRFPQSFLYFDSHLILCFFLLISCWLLLVSSSYSWRESVKIRMRRAHWQRQTMMHVDRISCRLRPFKETSAHTPRSSWRDRAGWETRILQGSRGAILRFLAWRVFSLCCSRRNPSTPGCHFHITTHTLTSSTWQTFSPHLLLRFSRLIGG